MNWECSRISWRIIGDPIGCPSIKMSSWETGAIQGGGTRGDGRGGGGRRNNPIQTSLRSLTIAHSVGIPWWSILQDRPRLLPGGRIFSARPSGGLIDFCRLAFDFCLYFGVGSFKDPAGCVSRISFLGFFFLSLSLKKSSAFSHESYSSIQDLWIRRRKGEGGHSISGSCRIFCGFFLSLSF